MLLLKLTACLAPWRSEVHSFDEGFNRGHCLPARPAALHGLFVIPELATEAASCAPTPGSLASVSEGVDVLAWLAGLLSRFWLGFSSAASGTGLGDAGDGSSEGLLLFLWALPGL